VSSAWAEVSRASKDAPAVARLPEGDAYRAAMTSFRRLAGALWRRDEAPAYLTSTVSAR
jgi:hypothetical protein